MTGPSTPEELDLLDGLFGAGGALDLLVTGGEVTEELLRPSDELARVARRIAGEYVQVVARHAAVAFGRAGAGGGDLEVRGALGALRRLAEAGGDARQLSLLSELDELLTGLSAPRASRAGRRAVSALGDWIPRFAETLEPEDARALLHLVEWDHGAAPLLEELGTIRGIGRRRLARLYAAGLFSVDTVANARPEEIAAVTGLPMALAEEVVDRTRRFAVEEHRRCLEDLRDRSARLTSLSRALRDRSDPQAVDLVAQATAALAQVLDVLATTGGDR